VPQRIYLDAVGKEFDIQSVLLYLKPITEVAIEDGTLTFRKQIGSEPIVVYPASTSYNAARNLYTIKALSGEKWNSRGFDPCDIEGRCDHEITGDPAKRNPLIYKLANSIAAFNHQEF
jgi:hypothetical protein